MKIITLVMTSIVYLIGDRIIIEMFLIHTYFHWAFAFLYLSLLLFEQIVLLPTLTHIRENRATTHCLCKFQKTKTLSYILTPYYLISWWTVQESNLLHHPCKGYILPIELTAQIFGGESGIRTHGRLIAVNCFQDSPVITTSVSLQISG